MYVLNNVLIRAVKGVIYELKSLWRAKLRVNVGEHNRSGAAQL